MPHIILVAADHGVASENVSAFNQSVTTTMVKNYVIHKGAALNAFASFINAPVTVANVGMKEIFSHSDLLDLSVARGTRNIAKGAAMTKEEAVRAVEVGRKLAKTAINAGAKYILPAEMGIGNTTSAAAMASAMLDMPPEKTTGRGTNIDNDKLTHKINVVRQAIEVNKVNRADGLDVLAKLGGFEFAAIAGMILEASENNAKIILDGLNTTVAALIAAKIDERAKTVLIPSHLAGEAAHLPLLKALNLTAVMDLDFHLGEACGSSILAKCTGIDNNLIQEDVESFKAFNEKKIPPDTSEIAREKMRERFMELSMPHNALGALQDIAIKLAGAFGRIEIPKNIYLSEDFLAKLGIVPENYLINKSKLHGLAKTLARAALYIANEMQSFDEAAVL